MSDTPNFFPDRTEWEDDGFIEEETILEEPVEGSDFEAGVGDSSEDDSAGGDSSADDLDAEELARQQAQAQNEAAAAEAESVAGWTLAKFASTDGGYARLLHLYATQTGVGTDQLPTFSLKDLIQKGYSIKKVLDTIKADNLSVQVDKSCRVLEALDSNAQISLGAKTIMPVSYTLVKDLLTLWFNATTAEAILRAAKFEKNASLDVYDALQIEINKHLAAQAAQAAPKQAPKRVADEEIIRLGKVAWNGYPSNIRGILEDKVLKPLTALYKNIFQSVDRAYGVIGVSEGNAGEALTGVNTAYIGETEKNELILKVKKSSYGEEDNGSTGQSGSVTLEQKSSLTRLLQGLDKAIGWKKDWFNEGTAFDKAFSVRSVWHLYHIAGYFAAYYKNGVLFEDTYPSEGELEYTQIDNIASEDAIEIWSSWLKNEVYSECFTYLCSNIKSNASLKQALLEVEVGKSTAYELDIAVIKLVEEYACKTKSVFVVRSVPSQSGVFWLQYLYSELREGKEGTVISSQISQKLTKAFSSMETTANSNSVNKGGVADGAKILHNGKEADINLAQYDVYTSLLVNDSQLYIEKPLFSYKPIETYIRNKVPLDAKNILIGRTLTNADYKIDMDSFDLMTIYATSRAGKGVMTLSVLAYLMASGVPVAYADGKPDMAGVMWNLQNKVGADRAAILEFYRDINYAELDGDEWYAKAGYKAQQSPLPGNMGKWGTWHPDYNSSVQTLADLFDVDTALLTNKDNEAKGSLCGYFAYTKFITMLIKLRQQFSKPVVVVLDELDNYLGIFSSEGGSFMGTNMFALVQKYKLTLDALKGARERLEKAKKEEECDKLTHKVEELQEKCDKMGLLVLNYITSDPNIRSDATGAAKAALPTGSLLASINQYASSNLKLILIGQNYDTLRGWTRDVDDTGYITMSEKQSILRAYRHFAGDHSITIQGNFKDGACKRHYETAILSGLADTGEYTRAIDNSYLHEGKEGVSGFWSVLAPGSKKATITKSYLVLNDNRDPYVTDMLKRLPESIRERVRTEDIAPNNIPRASVGFLGMMELISQGKTDNIKTSLTTAYDIIWDAFRKTKLCKDRGYTCLEQYIYDFSPESFSLDFDTTGDSYTGSAASYANEGNSELNNNPQGTVINAGAGSVEPQSYEPGVIGAPSTPNYSEPEAPTAPSTPNPTPEQAQGTPTPEQSQPIQPTRPTPVPIPQPNPVPVPPINAGTESVNTPYGAQSASQTTRDATAYKLDDAYQAQMDIGTPTDNPFVVYKGKGKHLRAAISKMLVKHLRRMAGGSDKGSLDAITSFTEDGGRIIVNNMPFVPTLDPSLLYCVPTLMKKNVAEGRWAAFLDLGILKKMPNLRSVNIKDADIGDCVWEDLGVPTYDTVKLKKKLKKCQTFIINGVDILEDNETEASDNKKSKSEPTEGVKKLIDKSKVANFANTLGTALGIEGCSADNHPVLTALGKSKGMRAMKVGALVGTASLVGSLLFTIANPFLIIGGLFTAGAYIKNCKDEAKK